MQIIISCKPTLTLPICIEIKTFLLTGYRTQDIGNEDLHQSLVQDVITAPHP